MRMKDGRVTPSELAVFASGIRHAGDMALVTAVAIEAGPDARRFASNTRRIAIIAAPRFARAGRLPGSAR